MAKSSPIFSILHYGIYEQWEHKGRGLPKIQKVTSNIPAIIDIEFGISINVKRGKGITLSWCIEHPEISDKRGRLMAPFEGREYVRNNDWTFYLGDTIWAPEHDKVGLWRMYIQYESRIIAEQGFDVSLEDLEVQKEAEFWKKRGF